MSVPLPLDELAAALDRRANAAYLITVGDDGRAHCVSATLHWAGGELVVPAGTTSARNAGARRTVVLLAPPSDGKLAPVPSDRAPGAVGADPTLDTYSLIVDAEVTAATSDPGGESSVRVRPTHAVFHRPAVAPDGVPGHDCVHVYDETQSGS